MKGCDFVMSYMSEKEFEEEMRKVRLKNKSIARKQELQKEKNKYKTTKKYSTTKLIAVYLFILLNVVLGFSMYMMYHLSDLTYLGVLITDIVAQLITFLIYVVKSTKENTQGGITYETAIRNLEMKSSNIIDEDEDAVG